MASIALDIDHPKVNPAHLYLRTVQIIQLVEGPPPPRRITSTIDNTSSSSSDCESSSSSSDSDSASLCSSYCSSDLPPEHLSSETSQALHSADANGSDDETFSVRMKRILAWRENFASTMGTTTCSGNDLSLALKRKSDEHGNDDAHSHSSKRSRSQKSSQAGLCGTTLDAHSCPACDAFFPSRQRLRQHGLDAGSNGACSVAVEYAFEGTSQSADA